MSDRASDFEAEGETAKTACAAAHVEPADEARGQAVDSPLSAVRRAVVITGSRHWNDADDEGIRRAVTSADLVIHGAARGADSIAARICREEGRQVLPMPAQWDQHGRGAGPRRNEEMLRVLLALRACGWEVKVCAFPLPDSRGTWDMVNRAHRASPPVPAWVGDVGGEFRRYRGGGKSLGGRS